MAKKSFSEAELRERLTAEQYEVTQNAATEMPGTGALLHNKDKGMYLCVVCGQELFSSDTKFESGSGWPSFYDVVNNENLELVDDLSHGMFRTEVRCANCGAHLGHLFEDGPNPTGQRYCINSAALNFNKSEEEKS